MSQASVAADVTQGRSDGRLASLILRLDLCNVTGQDDMDLSWNGVPTPTTSAKLQPSVQYAWNWNGMHGQLEAVFDLTHGDWVRQGDNEFRFVLRSRSKNLELPLRLWALRLEIHFGALPMRVGV